MSAGIELILSAPDVKPQLEEIINEWEKIIDQEVNAQKIHEEYIKAANLQFRQMELQNKSLREAAIDQMAEIEAATKALKVKGSEAETQTTKQKTGIIAVIKEYFNERAELKNLEKQITQVTKELENLDLKQRAISLSARRGNQASIKEFAANEKKIQELSGTLNDLNEKFDAQGAKVELSSKKFAGLTKAFNIIKVAGVAAFAAVTVAATAAFAIIVGLGKQNDQVQNQLERSRKQFAQAKQALADAVAPVAFTIGKIMEELATRLTNFFEKHSTDIFKFSAKVAGFVAGTFAFIGQAFDNTLIGFKKIGAETDVIIARIKLGIALPTANANLIGKAVGELAVAQDNLKKINKEFENSVSPNEEAAKAFHKTEASILKLGEAYFKIRNLTDEQIAALKKMREEYEKLNAEIDKQIESLNIKEAGPIAGTLLKAQLAAKAIEKQGEETEKLAVKLGKSQEEIDKIRLKVVRLATAIRQEAQDTLSKQLDDLRNETRRANQARVARLGGFEDEVKLSDIIAKAEAKRIEELEIALALKKTSEEISQINNEINKLIDGAIKDFIAGRVEKEFKNNQKSLIDQAKFLKEEQNRLIQLFNGDDKSSETKAKIKIEIDANDEKIDQVQAKLELLQKSGPHHIFIDTSLTFNDSTLANESGLAGLRDRLLEESGFNDKPPKLPFFAQMTVDIVDAFEDLKTTLTDIFGDKFADQIGTAFNFVASVAVSSVDVQLEAINLLVERRREAVEQLEEDIALEAEFKEAHLANDYELLRKDLEQKRALAEEAEKKQAQLEDKKLKIQRQQDSLAQASSLATAIASLFKGTAKDPASFTLALILSAVMLTAFAAFKLKAGKLARAYKGSSRVGETFGELAPGEGMSDAPGSDRGLSVVDKYGRLRGYMGGDEHLSKESVSRKHRKALDYLNENEGKFQNVNLLDHLKSLDKVRPLNYAKISSKIERYRETVVVVQHQGITKKDLEQAVEKAMEKHAQRMIDYHESRPDIVPTEWLKDYTERNSKSKKRIKSR